MSKALNTLKRKQPSPIPVHNFIARGWKPETNQWRMPVYPRLDETLAKATEGQGDDVWILHVDADVTLSQSEGNQPGPGEFLTSHSS
jgi:hypothetical protein